jgi:steroid 5-alpha reductase family enzyme
MKEHYFKADIMFFLHALFAIFGYTLLAVLAFQTLVFVLAIFRKNNAIADIAWGLGFILISAIALYLHLFFVQLFERTYPNAIFILLITLVCIWGLRLSIYLYVRNWHKPEDWRYAKWRQDWGRYFYVRSYLQVFVLQGLLMVIIGYPILLAGVFFGQIPNVLLPVRFYFLVAGGTALWLIGFFFQAVGDAQLYRFKKDPANKGRIMRYGLWRYTRHPNYFGEAAMWWGLFLICLVSARSLPDVALMIISPLTITFLLLRVSGVTMLEGKYKGNDEYEDYQRSTSSFIPMPVKRK